MSGIRQSAARTHAKQVNNLRGRYVKIFIVTSSELTSYKQTECLRFRSSPKKNMNKMINDQNTRSCAEKRQEKRRHDMHTAAISKVTITLAHFQKKTYNTN